MHGNAMDFSIRDVNLNLGSAMFSMTQGEITPSVLGIITLFGIVSIPHFTNGTVYTQ